MDVKKNNINLEILASLVKQYVQVVIMVLNVKLALIIIILIIRFACNVLLDAKLVQQRVTKKIKIVLLVLIIYI